ncbi:MAG: hypothetical protein JWR51_2302 [Devosia sp.]|uniref:TniQ family protein n=1 Tax=Devosia sp. TaxID=1871048 RepID=UPI00262D4F1D|nr:TniQ family protein [Devosia sp.]MDB5529199.1 hypothetical protein [Devosia sp.]
MVKLALTVPSITHETPLSLAFRLASRNARASARRFCSDMALSFEKLFDGDVELTASLAELAGIVEEELASSSIRRVGVKMYMLGHEPLHPSILRREAVRVCPACVLHDRLMTNLPPGASMAGRVAWQLRPARTCIEHHLPLLTFPINGTNDHHDFGFWLDRVPVRDLLRAAQTECRSPSGLEEYLDRRLFHAARTGSWLDDIPIGALSRCCEIVGAMIDHGRDVRLDSLGEDALHKAGGVGFAILVTGPRHLRDFLATLQERSGLAGPAGAQQMFGALYKWLAFSASGSDADAIRQVVRTHIVETLPVGPKDNVLGLPVEKRVIHSVSTAAAEYGLHIKTLRNNLVSAGIVTADETVVHAQAVFKADENESLLDRLRRGMPAIALRKYMHIDRVPLTIITTNRILSPIVSGNNVEQLFDSRDADQILADLGRGAVSVVEPAGNQVSVSMATRRANCSLLETLRLMLAGELTWVGLLDREEGYRALLIDHQELRQKVALPPLEGLIPSAIIRKLGIRGDAVQKIISSGHLSTLAGINPTKRCPQRVVPFEAFDRFNATYISLRDVARQMNQASARKALALLANDDIFPVREFQSYGAYLFLRSSLK